MGFETVAEAAGVHLRIPEGTQYSFYDSPYVGHRNTTAIDIYFKNNEALLPVDEAKVKKIRWFNAPKYRANGWNKEPLTLLDLGGNKVLKVLHVNPKVSVGEKLYLGDFFGECIVSGYLCPWSDSHAHFEIRPSKDPYRARGAFTLNIAPTIRKIKGTVCSSPRVFTVVEIGKYCMWVKPKGIINYLTALAVKVGNSLGYVDAGIPHYGLGGILLKDKVKASIGDAVYWDFMHLGYVTKTYPLSLLFIAPIEVFVDSIKVKGIGTYINGKFLKVIFTDSTGEKPWKEGDEVKIKAMVSS
ncbi:MAG: hypothetical protein B6U75_01200 [Desulfurococcales archaeon ex4484_217_1]|nr:MAG: hypothetical protein B6U75_01200 [Desulfurococcales archaeon ex4484_217_1]